MLTLEEYVEYRDDYIGVCLECGSIQENVEPDARHRPCDAEECGALQVFGAEELLIMGMVE